MKIGFIFAVLKFQDNKNRDISSVGLERCLDRAEVIGSNPIYPTKKSQSNALAFTILQRLRS